MIFRLGFHMLKLKQQRKHERMRLYMRNDWILDVLTDLRTFAELNGMPATADHLSDACLVVAVELANKSPETQVGQARRHEIEIGTLSGSHPAS